MSINYPACVACGHDIRHHLEDVIGKVRCIFRRTGVTSGGISGLHFEDDCDCTDYVCSRPPPKPERPPGDEAADALLERIQSREGSQP